MILVRSIYDATDRETRQEAAEASESNSGTYTNQRPLTGTPSRHKRPNYQRYCMKIEQKRFMSTFSRRENKGDVQSKVIENNQKAA